MAGAKIDVPNLPRITATLRKRIERARNLEPAIKVAAQVVDKLIQDSFRNSASPSGEAWEQLKPSTVAGRTKGSDKALVDTATLKNSTHATDWGKSIVFGSTVPYAATHQFGAEITKEYKPKKKRVGPKLGPVSKAGRRRAKKAAKTRKARTGFEAARRSGNIQGPRWSPSEQAAQKTGSYTVTIPARPFLPVDAEGDFLKEGPAGKAWDKIGEIVINYIADGKFGK